MSASVRAVKPSVNGWNAEYLEAQYEQWRRDPGAVSTDLDQFFRGFDLGREGPAPAAPPAASQPAPASAPAKQRLVDALVRAYRDLGHLGADLDPFGRERPCPQTLTPQGHGLDESDLDASFDPGGLPLDAPATLRSIIELLDETYCGSIGVEIGHIVDPEERQWLQQRVEEGRNRAELTDGQRHGVLERLHRAELFEMFLHKRYVGQKRFSLEGAESLIPLLERAISRAVDTGVEEVVMGMAHRGRLNVLNNILGKTYEQIFTEFEANWDEDFVDGGGDVKYHLGYSGDRTLQDGRKIRLVLSSNPSHLESVDAVVEGRCRAKQRLRGDTGRERVIPLLIHGDAAVIAQGMVQEVLNCSQLDGYTTGGTLHVVVNNLIGFTTGPEDARSGRYCTDIFRMLDVPILHVNGEHPEAVIQAADVAVDYRRRFKKDVVVDLWCYRKWGHNEGDDPSFTQPVMASLIKRKPSVLKTYAERLLAQEVITEDDVQSIRDSLEDQMERAQSKATEIPSDPTIDPGSWRWQGFTHEYSHEPVETGVDRETLNEIAESLHRVPEGFNLHRTLQRILDKRSKAIEEDQPLDWGAAEALAFGSLLVEGTAVRLTGQDSRRGTFGHRHAVLRDMETADPYVPLNHIRQMGEPGCEGCEPGDPADDGRVRQARFCLYDSPLSEEAIVAYEYGYSLADPNMLVIWEAQFGDFVNGAQVIIDQYLAAAEAKWQRWSGLTLLLPHSYEGQGPEHSSARLERFLQLCADGNMQVVYPTTPAQAFHVFRRQVRRNFRKPLVVMSPKSLLRLPEATSQVAELVYGRFHEIIDDPAFVQQEDADPKSVQRVILCSGKVFYDLARRREEAQRDDVAIVRVEQLYPLHTELLEQIVSNYPNAEVVWVQEEPKNAGAYTAINGLVQDILGWGSLPYIGRPASATPAVGSKKIHDQEQDELLTEAIGEPAEGGGAEENQKSRDKKSVEAA